jgi:Na+/H+ antiporter NhaD/arsenite permease-like protein
MNPLPFAELLVLLFAVLGYVPAILDYRASQSAKIFFAGFTAVVIGIVSQNIWLMNGNESFHALYHLVGIMGAGMIFLYWTQSNYESQQFMRKKMERMSRER